MNPKLICASLIGVSSIGGAVAGGIYLSKSQTNKAEVTANNEQESQAIQDETKEATPAETPKLIGQGVGNDLSSGRDSAQSLQTQQVNTVSHQPTTEPGTLST